MARGWHYTRLSIEYPSSIFFWHVYFVIVPFFLSFLFCFVLFFCSRLSFVDVPLIFYCPADHVPDWQLRILLGIMVEARSVSAKNTTTTTTICSSDLSRSINHVPD